MKIEALGHSAFLASLEREDGSTFRLLADPWIDDHVIGDVGGRFPRIRTDWSQIDSIDAVWISHAHTDHLCPYSLIKLHQEFNSAPALLIPASLCYLKDIFSEYLPGWPITVIEQDIAFDIGGIRARAFFNLRHQATNEDDCMILLLDNGREAILSEADAVMPMEDPEMRELIGGMLIDAGPEQRVFLTTRNELEATMASVDAPDRESRLQSVAEQRNETTMLAESEIMPNGAESCPWQAEGTVRILIGQGITVPHTLPEETFSAWNRVMFPVRLEDRARIEQEAALREGLPLQILALNGGESVTIENGSVATRTTIEGLEVLDQEQQRHFDGETEIYADFPIAPLRQENREPEPQHLQILQFLQQRYLPYLIWQRQPAVEHRISHYGGKYRVRIRYGNSDSWIPRDYAISFEDLRFIETAVEGDAQEEYWANDLDDYFQGVADDFTTFCRTFPGGENHEFWDCLGMPFLNDDLVAKKIRYHFERARNGKTAQSFVSPLWDFTHGHR
ncbi:MAG: hypothetical protein AAEJ04_11590 [Planctomycetota bacterium]